ncbi:hypothetical protein JCM8547_005916 [Rhodosporidiobolus lusitaniae]
MPVSFSRASLASVSKPIIAAVNGYALAGGCELAMMCDIILAFPTAVFGQPEINSRAMELVFTGRNFTAQEASEWGLVSRVVDPDKGTVVDEAVKVTKTIAGKGRIAVQAAKEGVNLAYRLSLAQGLHLERRLFHQLFATNDQKGGMKAFAEKEVSVDLLVLFFGELPEKR